MLEGCIWHEGRLQGTHGKQLVGRSVGHGNSFETQGVVRKEKSWGKMLKGAYQECTALRTTEVYSIEVSTTDAVRELNRTRILRERTWMKQNDKEKQLGSNVDQRMRENLNFLKGQKTRHFDDIFKKNDRLKANDRSQRGTK